MSLSYENLYLRRCQPYRAACGKGFTFNYLANEIFNGANSCRYSESPKIWYRFSVSGFCPRRNRHSCPIGRTSISSSLPEDADMMLEVGDLSAGCEVIADSGQRYRQATRR